MLRLALLFALLILPGCSIEQIAMSRHATDYPSAAREAQVLSECQFEASRRPRFIRASSAEQDQAFLRACVREKSIMLAHGRRSEWR